MTVTTFRNAADPKLFASVRGSRDVSLIAFGVALLAAFALHAGALIPRISAPGASHEARLAGQPAAPAPAPDAVVASPTARPCVLPPG
jgi:hypothetical protein